MWPLGRPCTVWQSLQGMFPNVTDALILLGFESPSVLWHRQLGDSSVRDNVWNYS